MKNNPPPFSPVRWNRRVASGACVGAATAEQWPEREHWQLRQRPQRRPGGAGAEPAEPVVTIWEVH